MFAGIPLEAGPAPPAGLEVKGGFLVPSSGYYRLTLRPECRAAELLTGPDRLPGGALRPYLAGAQKMEVRLPSAAACSLPLTLRLKREGPPGEPGEPDVEARLLSPHFVALPGLSAPRVVTDPGFGETTLVASFSESPMDVGVDGTGVPYVLLFGDNGWRLRRLGGPDGSFDVESGAGTDPTDVSLAVEPDGSSVVVGPKIVEIRDRDGVLRHSFSIPNGEVATDVVVLPWGDLLFSFPHEQTIGVFSPEGVPRHAFRSADQGPGHLDGPGGVALSSRGQLLVLDWGGKVHSFQLEKDAWPPQPLSAFQVDFPESPSPQDQRHMTFDGEDRIMFPQQGRRLSLVYTASGDRVLAPTPDGALGSNGIGAATALASTRDALFVVDSGQRRLYRVARR